GPRRFSEQVTPLFKQLSPSGHAELLVDGGDVVLDRLRTQSLRARDLAGGEPTQQQFEDLAFARGQEECGCTRNSHAHLSLTEGNVYLPRIEQAPEQAGFR